MQLFDPSTARLIHELRVEETLRKRRYAREDALQPHVARAVRGWSRRAVAALMSTLSPERGDKVLDSGAGEIDYSSRQQMPIPGLNIPGLSVGQTMSVTVISRCKGQGA